MAQEIFRRVEEKYVLSRAQCAQLLRRLGDRIVLDAYGRHTIRNIYFDTPDFRLVRASIDATVYKEKLRLRGYGLVGGDDTVFLELKKKVKGIVYKRRAAMTLSEANGYLSGGGAPRGAQILREIDYFARLYRPLLPRVFLAYERCAYVFAENPEMRFTLDENVRARMEDVRLDGSDAGEAVMGAGEVLMELKIPGAIPVWLSKTLAEHGIFSRGFSKYGAYYKARVAGGTERIERLYA